MTSPIRKKILALAVSAAAAFGQSAQQPDHASSYYYFALGHMYAELAGGGGFRGEYVTRAIDNYKLALKADPGAKIIADELSEFYLQAGRLREAQNDAEEALKVNPRDVSAMRLLARIYSRQIRTANNRVDDAMVRKTIEQYQKIVAIDPKDVDSWVMLGQLQAATRAGADAEASYRKALAIEEDNEDALTGLALLLSEQGKNDEANDMLRRAAAKNPSQRSLQALAVSYEQMKEYSLAADTIKKLLQTDPENSGELKHAMAADLIQADRLDDAMAVYQELVADEPGDAQAYLRMSQLHRQRRNFAAAREMNDKALAIEPGSLDMRVNNVKILESESKIDQAIAEMKSIVESTSRRNYNQQQRADRIRLLGVLGEMYRNYDRTDDAVGTYRLIEDLDSNTGPAVAGEVIESYRSGRQYTKAQQEAEAALRKFPDDPALHIRHATVLAEQGNVEPALAEVRKTLEARGPRELNLALAEIYDKGRKYDEMAKVLDAAEKASESKDDKSSIWFMRGAMLEKQKRYDQSEAEFRRVLEADPGNVSALNYLGYMNANRNVKLQESLSLIQKAVAKEPDQGAYLDSLGWAYYRLGRLEEAEPILREAALRTPRDPTVHDHLAEVLLKRSKTQEAVAQWEISLKEWQLTPPSEMDANEMGQVRSKLDSARKALGK